MPKHLEFRALLLANQMPRPEAEAWGAAARSAIEQGPLGGVRISVDARMMLALIAAVDLLNAVPVPAPAPAPADTFIL